MTATLYLTIAVLLEMTGGAYNPCENELDANAKKVEAPKSFWYCTAD